MGINSDNKTVCYNIRDFTAKDSEQLKTDASSRGSGRSVDWMWIQRWKKKNHSWGSTCSTQGGVFGIYAHAPKLRSFAPRNQSASVSCVMLYPASTEGQQVAWPRLPAFLAVIFRQILRNCIFRLFHSRLTWQNLVTFSSSSSSFYSYEVTRVVL